MKRWWMIGLLLLIAYFLLGSYPAKAASIEDTLKELYGQSGMEDAVDALDEETLSLLYGLGIDPQDAISLFSADLSALPGEVWKLLKTRIKAPIGMLSAVLGLLLFAVMLNGITSERMSGMPFDLLLTIASVGIFGEPTLTLLRQLSSVFATLGSFMELFLPTYAGIMAASGQTASAYGMQALTFGASAFITALMTQILLPSLSVYLALCMITAANDLFDTEALSKTVSSGAAWILGVAMSLFTIILGVQRMIAGAADTLGMKTAKFALSTLIPVVGGQLSDALSSMTTCFKILSSSLGGFSMLAVTALFLPVTVSLLLMLLTAKVSQLMASLFRVEAAKRMYTALSGGFGLLLGVTLCAFCATVIALALLWSTAAAL